ncbi:MAG TPA: IS3 family transposase, partial [Porticoccaceae bacterium]|nr:IS3 family transposase [Porticoccaceae bacterium]
MKYAFIQQQGANHAITTLCRVLAVSPSGYYDWLGRPESSRARETRQLVHKIAACHRASRATYGSPRIHQDLVAMGERVSVNRVARLM